jgi:hypothetical protein
LREFTYSTFESAVSLEVVQLDVAKAVAKHALYSAVASERLGGRSSMVRPVKSGFQTQSDSGTTDDRDVMNLRTLLEKTPDAHLSLDMIGFASQRLMELEVEGLTGATYGEKSLDVTGMPHHQAARLYDQQVQRLIANTVRQGRAPTEELIGRAQLRMIFTKEDERKIQAAESNRIAESERRAKAARRSVRDQFISEVNAVNT